MTDDDRRPTDPGSPFPLDLVADLHAGVLPEDLAQELWPRVMADPDARRILRALDATRDDLAAAPVHPEAPPAAVTAAIDSTLAAIAAENDAAVHAGRGAATGPVAAPVRDLDDERDLRRDASRRRGLLIALAAAAVISVVTLVIAVSTASMSSQGTVQNADPSASAVTTTGSDGAGTTGVDTPAATLLSVLGRTDAPFGPAAADPGRLQRCLAANGVPADTAVVGSGVVTVDGGTRTVILLSTGLAGRFDALVVGTDCDTGRPALITRRTIGAAPPTR